MKRQIAVIIKLMGLIFLVIALLSTLSMIQVSLAAGFGYTYVFMTLFYGVLPIVGLFAFFYICMYKTGWLIRFFKMEELSDIDEQEEIPFSMSARTAFKTGIFLIGFFLMALYAPNVIVQLTKWLIQELSTFKGNSLNDLLNLFHPLSKESLLYSLIYSVAGYVLAFENSRIADYFLSKGERKK